MELRKSPETRLSLNDHARDMLKKCLISSPEGNPQNAIKKFNEWRSQHYRERLKLPNLFLDNAYLFEALLHDTDLKQSDLSGAFARQAKFDNACLSEARLVNAHLQEASFYQADLRNAHLEATILTSAKCCEADLRGARVNSSLLHGVDFTKAQLEGTDFTGSVLQGVDFYQARFSDETVLPNGVSFGQFVRESLPRILTAGGKELAEVVDERYWDQNYLERVLVTAFGRKDSSTSLVPIERRMFSETILYDFNIPESVSSDLPIFLQLYKGRALPAQKVLASINK